MEINSDFLWYFCKNYKKDTYYVINSNDAYDFIGYVIGYFGYKNIYFKDENVTDKLKEREKIKEKFDEKFGSDNTVVFVFQSNSIHKTRGKDDESLWTMFINAYMF